LIGLRNRYQPSAVGLILDGILLMLLGGWLLTQQQAILLILRGGTVLGVVLILMSALRFQRYGQVRDAFAEPPTDGQVAWFDEIVAEIQAADAAADPTIVEFRSGIAWKGKRLGDVLIFTDALDSENLIVDRHDAETTDKGKALLGSARFAAMRFGRRTFDFAEIAPEQLERLQSWRTDEGVEGDGAEAPPDDEPIAV